MEENTITIIPEINEKLINVEKENIEIMDANLEELTVIPKTKQQIITPPSSKTYYNKVTVEPIITEKIEVMSSNEDKTVIPTTNKFINEVTVKGDTNLVPENIKKDVSILGVVGSLESTSNDNNTFTYGERRNGISSVNYLLDITINENVDNHSFYCSSYYPYIGNVTTTENCLEIGESAFRYQNLGVFDAFYVKKIGDFCFTDSKIKELYLPEVEDKFGQSACSGCTMLKKVTIGNKIKNFIGPDFMGCTSLDTFILYAENPPIVQNSDLFSNTPIVDGTGYIYVPDSSIELYKKATNWSKYADQIKGISELP